MKIEYMCKEDAGKTMPDFLQNREKQRKMRLFSHRFFGIKCCTLDMNCCIIKEKAGEGGKVCLILGKNFLV